MALSLVLASRDARGGEAFFSSEGPLGVDTSRQPRVVFALDSSGRSVLVATAPGLGILRTEDPEAVPWRAANRGLVNLFVDAIAVSPSNPRILYVSSQDRLVSRSTDGGKSWVGRAFLWTQLVNLAVDPTDPNIVHGLSMGTELSLLSSTDGGSSWLRRSVLPTSHLPTRLVIDPTRPSRLFVPLNRGILRTDDGGLTWSMLGAGLPQIAIFNLTLDLQGPTNPVRHLYVDPGSPYESTDGGDTWTSVDSRLSGSIHPDPRPPAGRAYWLRDDGVLTTVDGGATWTRRTYSYPGWNLLFDPQDPDRLFTFQASSSEPRDWASVSRDRGLSFWPANAPINARALRALAVSPWDPNLVYAAGYGDFYRSRDGGLHIEEARSTILGVQSIGPTPNPSVLFATTSSAFFRTTDAGFSWEQVPVPGLSFTGGRSAVVVDRNHGRRIWVAAGRVARSTDLGQTWALSDAGIEGAVWSLLQVAGPGFDELLAVAGAKAYRELFRSTDGGTSWTKTGSLPLADIVIAADPSDRSRLVAGGLGIPLQLSTDGGGTFQNLQGPDSMPPYGAQAISVAPTDGTVYVVDGRGRLWRGGQGGRSFILAGLDDALCGIFSSRELLAVTPGGRVYAATVAGLWWIDGQATVGDLNRDGERDVRDLVILANLAVGNVYPREPPLLTGESAADLDGNGRVEIHDLVLMAFAIASGVWPG